MTERYSLTEARELGLLDKPGTLARSVAAPAELKAAQAEIRRRKSFEKFVRELLEAELELRLEHRFHPTRKWRFDVAILDVKLAVEIDGGGWVNGRHHRPIGREKDNEKLREAQRLGWMVIAFNWEHVKSGEALRITLEIAQERKETR